MTFADFRKADGHLRARLAHANPTVFLALEMPRFAAYMALVLMVLDVLPWDLSIGKGQPVQRLLFILPWAIAMAFWQRWQVLRGTPPEASTRMA